MKTEFQFLVAGHTAQHAARRMRDRGVRFLPICKASGKVVGVLSDGDIAVRVVAEGRAPELCAVDEVMTRKLVTCRPEDDADVAERLMTAHGVSQVLVTDAAGLLKGMVDAESLGQIRAEAPAALTLSPARRRAPVPPPVAEADAPLRRRVSTSV